MFGEPTAVLNGSAIFNLVWTYTIKEVDGRKKARCTCDGSTRGGQVRVLDFTYANSPDHTCSCIFYAITAAENLLIFGADVSNAFAEAPPPKQGFISGRMLLFMLGGLFIWVVLLPPIPHSHVIPILSAMQGHPEAPRLWEKHANKILCAIGLTPTTHEPCLNSIIINNHRVLLLRQINDFSVAAPLASTAAHIFDLVDDHLTIPLKRIGLVTLFNGLDVTQTQDYVKISSSTYMITRICAIYLDSWMDEHHMSNKPTPLPQAESFLKSFHSAEGDPSPFQQ